MQKSFWCLTSPGVSKQAAFYYEEMGIPPIQWLAGIYHSHRERWKLAWEIDADEWKVLCNLNHTEANSCSPLPPNSL